MFRRQLKRLAKKYPSLKNDTVRLGQELQDDPKLGKSPGGNFYKVCLKITSKRAGKAGGARVITYVKIIDETVTLSFIYDKAERDTIEDSELDNPITLLG